MDAPIHDPDGGTKDHASSSDGSAGSDGSSGSDVVTHMDSPASEGGGSCAGGCPTGYTCGTANGMSVCRSAAGIPMFSHIFVILMENTSLSTLQTAMKGGNAPNLSSFAASYATGSDYHGVAHPSLPNYIALTSGGTQGIGCDCHAQKGQGSCSLLTCNLLLGSCSCDNAAMNLADQIEMLPKGGTWMAYGEDMGTPCNLVDSGNYAVRHLPFLYYDDIQTDMTRCTTHVVDFKSFNPDTAGLFTFIAPNLVDDMHNPDPTTSVNIPDGDKWIGPQVQAIMKSSSYTSGGLIVVVWDEDDGSGGITGSNDPVPIFLFSPYAKAGGYVSSVTADHYALLATFEDAMNLSRLGSAAKAMPLADYFPAK